ncbi:MAG: TolC family protein, partial [bacterium]|nr:TolC family protein [bacterium]
MNKKRQLKQLVAGFVTLLVGWVMLTAAAAPLPGKNKQLSLEECIAIARKTNPGLSSQTYDVEAAEAKIKEKKGDKLPFISANGTFIRFSESTAPPGETNDYNASVQVTQPLYSGGGLTSSVDKAGFNWKASAFRYDSRLQSLILEVKETYFEVLKQKRLTRVAEKTLKQAETYLEAAKERFRLGVARLGDTIKAEVEVSDAQLNLIKSQNALLTMQARLNKVMGLPVTGTIFITDLLENDVNFSKINYSEINYSKGEIKSLLAMAEKKLPELKEMAMNIQAQQAAVKISRSE